MFIIKAYIFNVIHDYFPTSPYLSSTNWKKKFLKCVFIQLPAPL